jgi:DNA-binding PadR family transcriptional regulator
MLFLFSGSTQEFTVIRYIWGVSRLKSVQAFLPLTEAFYYLLIALYTEPAHGYGIMQDVEQMSSGRVRIGAGTLYTALSTLLNKGLIEHAHVPEGVDSRRKMYAITENGKRVVAAEMKRMEELLENGRKIKGIGM